MNTVGFNTALRLPFIIDENEFAQELAACLGESWRLHFNTKDYRGNWTALALRSVSGSVSDINAGNGGSLYEDTPLMKQCPAVSRLLGSLLFEKETVRFMRLDPGAEIKEHSDPGLSYRYDSFRLHIPLMTDHRVEFVVGGHLIPMKAGECWYADFDLPHSVRNKSDIARIHLVIDGKRNEWTDRIFVDAGYDLEVEQRLAEKNYDADAIDRMIESLESMNTPASRSVIENLKERKARLAVENERFVPLPVPGWIPDAVAHDGKKWNVHWTFAGEKKFKEPFFQHSLKSCRSLPENGLWKGWLEKDSLVENIPANAVSPSAFIFHISRCGSTLLTQMVAECTEAVVVSEPPVLDEILGHPLLAADVFLCSRMFRSAVAFMGAKPSGSPLHYLVKCDSWHLLYYERIREMYPDVPFILLYRSPDEVVRSHSKIAGMHAVPGILNPALFGLSHEEVYAIGKEKYIDHVMQIYLRKIIGIAETDEHTVLMSYGEGPMQMLEKYCAVTGLKLDGKMRESATERMKFHSKEKTKEFSIMTDKEGEGIVSWETQELHLLLEEKRTGRLFV